MSVSVDTSCRYRPKVLRHGPLVPIAEPVRRTNRVTMNQDAADAGDCLRKPKPVEPVIDVEGFSLTYPGASRPAVQGVSFSVMQGEIFGFLGPSGAGKSTTQNVLIRLLDGYEDSISVLGQHLPAWNRNYYRRIGVAFESPNHYLKLTARENLRLFAGLHGGACERPDVLLERVGLIDDADKRVGEFSKGMRVRLTLARALLHRPELLFLDEPTAGLDPVAARRIRKVILETRAAGSTIFLTTHDMVTADELCDRVAFLVDGRIEAIDEPRKLRLAHGRRCVKVELDKESGRSTREFSLDGLAENEAFLSTLRSGRVETIHTLETSLEDVFVRVTGRSLK
jgi:fluoroquinolone transport system ATP-binding protein